MQRDFSMQSNTKRDNFLYFFILFSTLVCLALSCGTPAIPPVFSGKIINGEDAKSNSYPWIVSLRLNLSGTYSNHFCGGSIIDENTILTAAHCVVITKNISLFTVFVGLHDSTIIPADTNIFSVSEVYIHPEYNDTTLRNDVAVLKLTKSLTFSDKVSTICLPSANSHKSLYNKEVVAAGWGATQSVSTPTFLQQAKLRVINETYFEDIQSIIPIFYTSEQYAVIEDGINPDKNVCSGDSGGPLVFYDERSRRWTLYGITSFVFTYPNGTCNSQEPSFFASVPFYLNYINEYLTSTSTTLPTSTPLRTSSSLSTTVSSSGFILKFTSINFLIVLYYQAL